MADIRTIGLAVGITVASALGDQTLRPCKVVMAMCRKGISVRCGGEAIQPASPFVSTSDEVDLR